MAPANKSTLLTGSGASSPEMADACSFAPWKMSAKRTSTMDGGIIWPRVPLAQITPVEIFLLYFHLIISGSDNIPIVTTVAPTMPVDAAIRTPTIKIE